jgi:3-hydroxybutyrate dehydrogenase
MNLEGSILAGSTRGVPGSRRVVVTGAGGGIGAAVARVFAAAGDDVTVADVNDEAAHQVAEEIGGHPWTVDLSDTARLAELRLDCDVLVNNAGVQHVSPVEDFPPEKFRFILALMLEAPFLLIRAALPHMYAHGWGRIINISSVHGLVASPFKSAYVSAKHGLEGLSKTVALEGGGRGVTSNCICPGYVNTALVAGQVADQARTRGITPDEVLEQVFLAETAVKRMVQPLEVAELALFLAGQAAGMANGGSYPLDGGWSAR